MSAEAIALDFHKDLAEYVGGELWPPAVQPGKWGSGDVRVTGTRGELGPHPRSPGQGVLTPSHEAAGPQSQGSRECRVRKCNFLLEINGDWMDSNFTSIAT